MMAEPAHPPQPKPKPKAEETADDAGLDEDQAALALKKIEELREKLPERG